MRQILTSIIRKQLSVFYLARFIFFFVFRISPNLKNIVYCTAIRFGSDKEWEFAWDRFQKTTISSEKELLLSALGCSREPWILMRYLERSMTSGYGIRKQDVFRVFIAVSNNVIGQRITFNYIKNNWQKMKD